VQVESRYRLPHRRVQHRKPKWVYCNYSRRRTGNALLYRSELLYTLYKVGLHAVQPFPVAVVSCSVISCRHLIGSATLHASSVHWCLQCLAPSAAEVSVVCNAVFRLTISCCFPGIFAIKSRSCAKLHRKFDVFFAAIFFWGGGRGHPNFWPNSINLGHLRTCGKVWWRSAKRTRRLGGEKRRGSKLQRFCGHKSVSFV